MSTVISPPNYSEFLPPDSDIVPECSSFLRVAHRFYNRNSVGIAYHCVNGAFKKLEWIDRLSDGRDVSQFSLSLSIWLKSTFERSVGRRNMAVFSLNYLKVYCEVFYEDCISPLSGERPVIKFSRSYLAHICQIWLVLFNVLDLVSEDEKLSSKILEYYAEVKRVADIFSEHEPITIRELPEVQPYQAKVKSILKDLQSTFGFQKDNVENQSEHLTLLLANVHLRMYPNKEPPDIQGEVLDAVMNKLLDNYIRWYKFLDLKDRRGSPHIEEETDQQRKLQYVGLYLLIWGEAANLRFMPECLCYIYHHMAFELFEKLEKRVNDETGEPKLPAYGDENEAFLMKLVTPIYQTIAMEAERGAKGKHAEGRNYDDLNEYFWSTECFQLGWPMDTSHPFFAQNTVPDRLEVGDPVPNVVPDVKKVNFIERRSFFHIFRSFDRMWVFYILSFQAMIINAWNEAERLPAIFEFHYIMSMFTTLAGLDFARALINIYLSWDALFKFTCFMNLVLKALCTMFSVLPYFCNYSSYTFFYVLAILCYVSSKLMIWSYQPRLYIGRGMDESAWSYFKYMMFWFVLLFAKFGFNYYAQIRPLVSLTKEMMQLQISVYRFPELFSPAMKIIGLVISLWSPVICVYFMDTQIWYAIVSTLVGGLIGFFIRLGEVQTLGVFRTRFQFLPRAFNDLLVPISEPEAPQNVKQTKFCQMWNSIIDCFRKEDLISNWEMELLMMPDWKKLDSSEDKEGDPIRWPLYLVASKIPIAINMAKGRHGEVGELTERLNTDIYMNSAVKECYASFKFLVTGLVSVKSDEDTIKHIFNKIDEHIERGTLLRSVNWSSLSLLLEGFVKLIGYFVSVVATSSKDTRAESSKADLSLLSEESKKEFEKILPSMLDIVRNNMMIKDLQGMDIRLDCFKILNMLVHIGMDWEKNIKRLNHLLTLKESVMDVPSNLEARRRLIFFSNSLFMKMPDAPKFNSILSFSALTPYYSEDVFFSSLEKKNDDGISILYYLQKIFPDEWTNFLERVGCDSKEAPFPTELCLWASYRGQTVARTVRGIMYYQKALKLQAFWDLATNEELRKGYSDAGNSSTTRKSPWEKYHPRVDMKFSYVLSCQQYSNHKKSGDSRAKDIQMLMNMYPELRVAYVDEEDAPNKDGTDGKFYYSALVKADPEDREKDLLLFKIKLPGPPIIGEGKPENQNHAIIFSRGEALQTIDMNQDNYIEESFKMRNLLQEFHEKHGGVRAPTILGLREHIFTGSVSSLAWFMSNQENSFVTLGQRVLATPLRVRFHYGHPDVFDRLFHISRGGVSKASKTINLSEDIFGGFNSTLREGNITHHEYIQVGKGRDVGLNQISMFEAKISNGSGEQTLSRDVYRLGNQFDFFRMLSFYFTTVGFYFCSMLNVLTVYVFLYGRLYLVLSGIEREMWKHPSTRDTKPLQAVLSSQSVVQIGFLMALPMIMAIGVENGFHSALFNIVLMQLHFAPVFFTFQLGTKAHHYGRTLLHGGAEYRATGRGFVVSHSRFTEIYRLYARSHFIKGFELALLLVIYHVFGAHVLITYSIWFMAGSFLLAPFLFNPSGFEWYKIVDDWKDWIKWIYESDFGELSATPEQKWESWWEKEQDYLQHSGKLGSTIEILLALRFFIIHYGLVYQLTFFENNKSYWVFVISLFMIIFIMLIVFTPNKPAWQRAFRTMQLVVFLIVVGSLTILTAFSLLTLKDIFVCMLVVISAGWGLLLIAQSCKPLIQRLRLSSYVKKVAWLYDLVMGTLLLAAVTLLALFSFVSEIQTRILFNQDFSRGLQTAHIFGGHGSHATPL